MLGSPVFFSRTLPGLCRIVEHIFSRQTEIRSLTPSLDKQKRSASKEAIINFSVLFYVANILE